MAGKIPMILLDTCVLLWLPSERGLLSKAAINAIEPAKDLCVSAVSAYEIGQKWKLGKVQLSKPIGEWFDGMLKSRKLKELPLTSKICAAASVLPGIHKDPFDRFLIATALEYNFSLVTPDANMSRYPGLKIIW